MTTLDVYVRALPGWPACADYPPEWWETTDKGQPADRDAYASVRGICSRCPVREACLAEADDHGIWGGLTPEQRKRKAS